MKYQNFFLLIFLFIVSCQDATQATKEDAKQEKKLNEAPPSSDTKSNWNEATLTYGQEVNIKNVKQLTFGGDNAEAYFSFDDKHLVFQATNKEWGTTCDQIYYMPVDGYTEGIPPMISTGKGRTTCSFFMPGNQEIIYSSTHLGSEACPQAPRTVNGKYVWGVFSDFDIFVADLEGNIKRQLTDSPGYDAEPTISPDGKSIVFTSTRSGDLELYTMNIDGSNVKQITSGLGYDGGAFFSPDSKKLVFRASRPTEEADIAAYKDFLSKDLVQPTNMEIFVCNVDGSELTQVTKLGGANWAPYFHPSGEKIIFSSNHHSRGKGRPQFNLFMINLDGTGLKQITRDGVFDAFPMFSYDGKKLVFSSNRNNGGTRDTNMFIADWSE